MGVDHSFTSLLLNDIVGLIDKHRSIICNISELVSVVVIEVNSLQETEMLLQLKMESR